MIKTMIFKKFLLPLLSKLSFGLAEKAWFAARVLWYRNWLKKKFRVSFAGLISIKTTDGKNLLVQSKRVRNKYQLPGGVYFYHNNWPNKNVLAQDEVMNNIPKSDMRFKVQEGQELHLPKVFKQFEEGTGREREPRREFFEELINTGVLPKALFSEPVFNHTHTHKIDFELTNGPDSEFCSLYRFEIFELFLNPEQQKFVDELSKNENAKGFVFATKYELIRGLEDHEGMRIVFPDFVKSIL